MPVSVHSTRLADIFEKVVDETRVRHPGIVIDLRGASADTQGEWDEGRMGQLLSNLLENAILYGARNTQVTVALTAEADYVGFSVHNQGKPIATHDRERIFEPRMRGPQGEGHESLNGLGLGLYICREIVRAHSGTLALRSSQAEGTTFLGRLPRQQPATARPTAER